MIPLSQPIIFPLLYNRMEEARLTKTCSGKEPAPLDPVSLHLQCQEQLMRLNQQLGHQISCQRNTKLNRIVPSISSLNQQIRQIENSISHQVTVQESSSQKQMLLHRKQALIETIQAYSRKIEKYKKQMIMLNINHEQLMRECEENSKMIQEKEKQMVRSVAIDNKKNHSRVLMARKQSMPFLYTKSKKKLQRVRNPLDETQCSNQLKWPKIQRVLDKLSSLQLNGLSQALVAVAKRENGNIKGVFKDYKTSDRISQFCKSEEVKQELNVLKHKQK